MATTSSETKKQVELGIFEVARTSVEHLQRTLEYAQNPLEYLNKTIGTGVVKSRKEMLSIPDSLPYKNDGYGTGSHKEHFEEHIASLFGKSHSLFFITGIQAQSVACKIYAETSNKPLIAWHASAHLEFAEQHAVTSLYGLKRAILGSDTDKLPTVSEIDTMAKLPEAERPAMILLEIPCRTLACETYTFAELEQISLICKKARIALHCDGARIWDIEPFYKSENGKTFGDIAALFDSIYVSFYKGLGGASGAMLLSNDTDFMLSARVWQRRAGGNPYTLMYELIDCERGFNENIGTFDKKWSKSKEIVRGITEATKQHQVNGKPIISFRPKVPTCCNITIHIQGYSVEEFNAARDKVLEKSGVKLFGRLMEAGKIPDVDELVKGQWKKAMKIEATSEDESNKSSQAPSKSGTIYSTSYTLYAPELQALDTSVFVEGWTDFCDELIIEKSGK